MSTKKLLIESIKVAEQCKKQSELSSMAVEYARRCLDNPTTEHRLMALAALAHLDSEIEYCERCGETDGAKTLALANIAAQCAVEYCDEFGVGP